MLSRQFKIVVFGTKNRLGVSVYTNQDLTRSPPLFSLKIGGRINMLIIHPRSKYCANILVVRM